MPRANRYFLPGQRRCGGKSWRGEGEPMAAYKGDFLLQNEDLEHGNTPFGDIFL